jgi:hypothetical protein
MPSSTENSSSVIGLTFMEILSLICSPVF